MKQRCSATNQGSWAFSLVDLEVIYLTGVLKRTGTARAKRSVTCKVVGLS